MKGWLYDARTPSGCVATGQTPSIGPPMTGWRTICRTCGCSARMVAIAARIFCAQTWTSDSYACSVIVKITRSGAAEPCAHGEQNAVSPMFDVVHVATTGGLFHASAVGSAQ